MTLPFNPVERRRLLRRNSHPRRWPKRPPPDFRSVVNNRPDFEGGPDQPTSRASRPRRAPPGSHTNCCRSRRTTTAPEEIARFAELLTTLPKPILVFCRSGARSTKLYNAATAPR